MRLLRTHRGLLMGFVVLALVAAACGSKAAANESGSGAGGGTTTSPTTGPTGSSGGSGYTGGGGYGGGGMTATTVMEGPGNSYTFSPSTVKVNEGQTITLENVSDDAHTFTVIGQSIDIETLPGKTSHVAIDLPPGTYRFVCRFHRSMGMKGLLLVRSAIE
jgi:plastocyanin